MNYLFIHQNFPAQYQHVARHLASKPENRVFFVTQPNGNSIAGVNKVVYPKDERGAIRCHTYAVELERAVYAGAAVEDACRELQRAGFVPDLVVGHSGWGETLFLKDVFRDVPLLVNCEFYYRPEGADVGFDPEFASIFSDASRLRSRNGILHMAFDAADWGHSATHWQRSLHPAHMRDRISVLHEGIDTARARPKDNAHFAIPGSGRLLTRKHEVVTYVARNLEPYRGFHVFMRSLPTLLRRRKNAQIVIAGGDGVSYGAPAPPQSNYRRMMLEELGDRLDIDRVHFVGRLDYENYLRLLQVSSAHVYLTYPFVLSWSLLEAMACGCAVIASKTAPVLEVLREGSNGVGVDFFDQEGLALRVASVLANRSRARALGVAARSTVLQQFDLGKQILPRWLDLFDQLIDGRGPAGIA